jgi:predicted RNA binding protein YcfA (HicA-like mRNA interferase family)
VPKLKRLSGKAVIAILAGFGFAVVSQRGSHVKLQRVLTSGGRQILTVPSHDELDPGTCRAIFRQASRYIPAEQLHPHFYTDS